MPTISIYDKIALRTYFDARVPKPGWRPWFGIVDSIPEKLELPPLHGVPVDVGRIAKALRNATLASRTRFVAYYWLYPFNQDTPLDSGLGFLLKQAGLDHLERSQALNIVSEECERLCRDHPDIVNWQRVRVALLEFGLRQSRPPQFGRVLFLLRNQLLRVINLLWQAPEEAVALADDLIDQALRGAAQVVHAELGGNSKGTLNASLMLPSRTVEGLGAALTALGIPAQDGMARAQTIWTRLPSEPQSFLVVAAETVRHQHVGFWVPLVEGDGGKRLPGAPEAYANHTGSAVFRHDVPKLHGFGDEVNSRWAEHIRTRVRGRHFVSLPFLVERNEGLGAVVPAVLNVNADPGEGAEWYRAVHPEWLACARDGASPFVEVAFYAIQAKLSVLGPGGPAGPPLLDTLAPEWRLLPGAPVGLPRGQDGRDEAPVQRAEAGRSGDREGSG